MGTVVVIAIGLFLGWIWIRDQQDKQKALQSAKDEYFASLERLSADPGNTNMRVECLEKGRIYYALILPDTHTVHCRNGIRVGTSDHQDNTAGREARIAADIAARTAKAA
jgi:hypothetical protein